jgi:hypothetical protein
VLIACHISKGICQFAGRAPSFGVAVAARTEARAGFLADLGAAVAAGALAAAMINADLVEEETRRAVG